MESIEKATELLRNPRIDSASYVAREDNLSTPPIVDQISLQDIDESAACSGAYPVTEISLITEITSVTETSVHFRFYSMNNHCKIRRNDESVIGDTI